jgi:hypothetical protein
MTYRRGCGNWGVECRAGIKKNASSLFLVVPTLGRTAHQCTQQPG